MITFESKGNFDKTTRFLKKAASPSVFSVLDRYGREGVQALAAATPAESGASANSWDYEVSSSRGSHSITWFNRNLTKDGIPVVILLQYGHATGTGGYVQGRDFINPVMKPLFDKIEQEVWKAVTTV